MASESAEAAVKLPGISWKAGWFRFPVGLPP